MQENAFHPIIDMGQSQTGKSLAFAADLCVRVPECEVDGVLFFKNHFEGGYLFRDMVILEATTPTTEKGTWKVEYRFASDPSSVKAASVVPGEDHAMTIEIPVEQPKPPGIKARLRVETGFWNRRA